MNKMNKSLGTILLIALPALACGYDASATAAPKPESVTVIPTGLGGVQHSRDSSARYNFRWKADNGTRGCAQEYIGHDNARLAEVTAALDEAIRDGSRVDISYTETAKNGCLEIESLYFHRE